MAKDLKKVSQMCGCNMPVVPSAFDSGCLTLPEQVGKLTYTVNETIDAVNEATEMANESLQQSQANATDLDDLRGNIPQEVREALQETGSPFIDGNFIDGVEFTGKKAITHFVQCLSAASAVNKVIPVVNEEVSEPENNTMIAVRFANGTDKIANATLSFTNGSAIPIYNGEELELPKTPENGYIIFHYNGNAWYVVASGESEEAERIAGNTINGVMFTGAKPITMMCYTTTNASSNNKIITPQNNDGVSVQNGTIILIRFVNGNTYEGGTTYLTMGNASNPATPVYYNGTTVGLPQIPPNGFMLFAYYNSAWYGSLLQSTGGATSSYVLPAATRTSLGGVIIGEGIDLNLDGTISVTGQQSYVLPIASAGQLGGIKIGSGLNIAEDGTVSAQAGESYELPIATQTMLGGVKVGSGISLSSDGTISISYPAGSKSQAGIVKVGDNIDVSAGVISVPLAQTGSSGVITINPSKSPIQAFSDGVITIQTARGLALANSNGYSSIVLSFEGGSTGLWIDGEIPKVLVKSGSFLKLTDDGLAVDVEDTSSDGQVLLSASANGKLAANLYLNYDSDTKTLNINTSAG